MPKVLIIAGVSVLALGLVLGLALPGLAAPEGAPPWADDFQIRIVKGKVISVDEVNQEFRIQSGEEELPIKVDENTKYYKLCVPGRIISLVQHWRQFGLQHQILQPEDVPLPEPQRARLNWLRPFGGDAEFSDIEVGDRVVVWLANEDNLAGKVLIIKSTTYASVSGAIAVDLDEGTITITPDDGGSVTLSYDESTVFILNGFIAVEEGQYARAIYDSDNMLAKRVTVSLIGD